MVVKSSGSPLHVVKAIRRSLNLAGMHGAGLPGGMAVLHGCGVVSQSLSLANGGRRTPIACRRRCLGLACCALDDIPLAPSTGPQLDRCATQPHRRSTDQAIRGRASIDLTWTVESVDTGVMGASGQVKAGEKPCGCLYRPQRQLMISGTRLGFSEMNCRCATAGGFVFAVHLHAK